MKKLPKFLEPCFWDVDFEKLDHNRSRSFVLKRILEYGDRKAVAWMKKVFSSADIEDVLLKYRISPKSANFWAVVLGIDRKKIPCLQKPYLKMRRACWPY